MSEGKKVDIVALVDKVKKTAYGKAYCGECEQKILELMAELKACHVENRGNMALLIRHELLTEAEWQKMKDWVVSVVNTPDGKEIPPMPRVTRPEDSPGRLALAERDEALLEIFQDADAVNAMLDEYRVDLFKDAMVDDDFPNIPLEPEGFTPTAKNPAGNAGITER